MADLTNLSHDELVALARRLARLLREREWAHDGCESCASWRREQRYKHSPTCEFAAALREAGESVEIEDA